MDDHRKLGRELGLFDTDPLIGAGLPYWLPAGAAVRHATRAPAERPPQTSARPASSSARSRSITAIQALSSRAAGGEERRPATR